MHSSFYKVVLLGESGVGKTAVLDRFVNKRFTGNFKSTIGADFLTQEIEVDNRLVTLQIWDTAGQERFNSLSKIFYRGADCCFLVFDVTRMKTLNDLSFWKQEFVMHAEIESDTDFPFIVLGNRCDLEDSREVSMDDALSWCRSHGNMRFLETSAKSGLNVEKAFRLAIVDIISRAAAEKTEVRPFSELDLTKAELQASSKAAKEESCC